MRFILKSMLTVSAIFIASAVCAQDDDDSLAYNNVQGSNATTYDQGHMVKENQMTSIYNAPARIDTTGWDVNVVGKFLWWEATEDNLDYSRTVPEVIDNGLAHSTTNYMESEWKPGFKVGLGLGMAHDKWSLYGEYTWFRSSHTSRTDKKPGEYLYPTFPLLARAGNTTNSLWTSANWKLTEDLGDLIMFRTFYSGKNLTLLPFFGIRGGRLNQNWDSNYLTTDATATPGAVHAAQKTWLVGPRGGIDGNWIFGAGVRFFGNTSLSLLYENFNTTFVENQYLTTQPYTVYRFKDKVGYFNPNFDLAGGLGWGSYFNNNTWHFDISAEYTFQVFWNQNMIKVLRDKVNTATGSSVDDQAGDLFLQGLTATVKFEF